MIDNVLSSENADLFQSTLARLRLAGLEQFAITGGIAISWHTANTTGFSVERTLHDLDIVVADFRSIPTRLSDMFVLWHVHSDALPGRMLVQAVVPLTELRVDIFDAYGNTLSRSHFAPFRETPIKVVSFADVVSRLAALLLDLELGETVPPKHARDFYTLMDHAEPADIDAAWQDHRRRRHPAKFAEARRTVLDLIARRTDLLVDRGSPYQEIPCQRCRGHLTLKVEGPEGDRRSL